MITARITLYQGDAPIYVDWVLAQEEGMAATEPWQKLTEGISAATALGFALQPAAAMQGDPSLGEDEVAFDVTSYALGFKQEKDGTRSDVVHLFAHGKYKVVSIWSDKMDLCWFQPDRSKIWPVAGGAPDKETGREYIHPCPKRKVIARKYTNSEGQPRKAIDRVIDTSNGQPQQNLVGAAPAATGASPAPQAPAASMQPSTDPEREALAIKIAETFAHESTAEIQRFRAVVAKAIPHMGALIGTPWKQVAHAARKTLALMSNSYSSQDLLKLVEEENTKRLLGSMYDDVRESFLESADIPF